MNIEKVTALPDGISKLATESTVQGFRFVERLISEFTQGKNRFDGDGEALFAAYLDGELVGIGGVNQDPYRCNADIGRVRRLYVMNHARSLGVGKALMQEIEQHASQYFDELQLFTDTSAAANFYSALGYSPVGLENISHQKALVKQPITASG
ncbi:GNAT family N-acetyltransferase [Bacterioplanes sanyensis]|uniref:GNAT family N-acetyltransferase n=1 Tax=Bacterioplanes sanyensis TaxID=1249553 RepID=A0A222FIB5_9GAMM|nr:GNAT family N-acetyltransferase [Bacterioplanes sanyensis]ASP38797.1 GNAT family N-acetyltransferase [Bacterioplanes sanyensis]